MNLLETEIRGEPKSVPEIVREASELRAETIARLMPKVFAWLAHPLHRQGSAHHAH